MFTLHGEKNGSFHQCPATRCGSHIICFFDCTKPIPLTGIYATIDSAETASANGFAQFVAPDHLVLKLNHFATHCHNILIPCYAVSQKKQSFFYKYRAKMLIAVIYTKQSGYRSTRIVQESDDDHVIAVYRTDGFWGSIGKSNYAGLRFRSPVYRTLRELALSYFEHYYNLKGEKTLRAYSRPVNLTRFDRIGWMTSEEALWAIPEHLVEISHTPIFHATRRMFMDERLYKAGLVGRAE